MSYNEALDFLYYQLPMFQRQGPKAFKKDLKNIRRLAGLLGNPEKKLNCIHVAGTNGKGTTSHLLAAMLQAAGYRVGLYTSPHYKDFRERIKINGRFIDKKSVVQFVQWFRKQEFINASFFEITVAMAFSYFKKEKVDIAIIETGLGGRLDSTNIVDPLLSVITNISFDHVNFLGNTLELIATEKAGIIKKNRPVVIGRKQPETTTVFEEKALSKDAPIFFTEDLVKQITDTQFTRLVTPTIELNVRASTISTSPFYIENLKTALTSIEILSQLTKFEVSKDDVKAGVDQMEALTYFIGRWAVLGRSPLIIGDSAHNYDGLYHVIQRLLALKKRKLHFVLGFVYDKDLTEVLKLFPADATYYFAKADIPRGLEAEKLKKTAANFKLLGKSYTSIRKAFAAARMRAGKEDLIFVGGSIFTLAEVL